MYKEENKIRLIFSQILLLTNTHQQMGTAAGQECGPQIHVTSHSQKMLQGRMRTMTGPRGCGLVTERKTVIFSPSRLLNGDA